MKFHLLTTVANFDSVASLSGKEETTKSVLSGLNFSSHDLLLFLVTIIGIIVLGFAIISVMFRQKREQ